MLLAMYAGYRLFSFAGIFIGPALVIVGKAIWEAERNAPEGLA
jgi:predicted PurR-regulated permease PerM